MHLRVIATTVSVLLLLLSIIVNPPVFAQMSQQQAPDLNPDVSLNRSPELVLDRIVLEISPDQIVGRPLQNTARMLLLDENGQPVTDYDLAANPITLSPNRGALSPSVISDPALLVNGVVDLIPANIVFEGLSGAVTIVATADTITSTPLTVSFSGYDVLEAFEQDGSPISVVYSSLLTPVEVVVRNGGALAPVSRPELSSYFLNGGGSVKSLFSGGSGGETDTVSLNLPTDNLPAGQDTLVLRLESIFELDGTQLTSVDSLLIPVTVLQPAQLLYVDDSFTPDSVYPGSPFDLGFRLAADGFTGPIDSAFLTVRLFGDTAQPALTTIHQSRPTVTSFSNDTLVYDSLAAEVPVADSVPPGTYVVRLDFSLVSEGTVYAIDDLYPDSLTVAAPSALAYVDTSLTPEKVIAGQEISFEFQIDLGGTDSLLLNSTQSSITITGDGFSTTKSLVVPGNVLQPGLNVIQTGSVFIPMDQLGVDLTAAALLRYRAPGVANFLSFATDFNGQLIAVEELPSVRIGSTLVDAPNAPRVNTGQTFQIFSIIANTSSSFIDTLQVRLTTDGDSQFEPVAIIENLQSFTTDTVFYDIIADSAPNPAERFVVTIVSPGVTVAPPDNPADDEAIITIEEPADLSLDYSLPGVVGGFVNRGANFSLVLNLTNAGQAAVTPGRFSLSTGGVDLGIDDPYIDTLGVGPSINLPLNAPNFDTTIILSFEFTELPIDKNDTMPAVINRTTFVDTIRVVSLQAELVVSSRAPTTSLILPGAEKDILELTLENRGGSVVTGVDLQSIGLEFSNSRGELISPRSVVEIGNTGFFENGERLTVATSGEGILLLNFDEFLLAPSSSRTITLRANFKNDASGSFTMTSMSDDITALFTSGPQAGQQISVRPPNGGDSTLVNRTYTLAAGVSLEESFTVRDNPFNPNLGPAEFQFNLMQDSEVEFRVFTLLGEEVFTRTFAAGELATAAGDPLVTFTWDGRNGEGNTVLNGVYIVYLRIAATGEETTLKVAVVK